MRLDPRHWQRRTLVVSLAALLLLGGVAAAVGVAQGGSQDNRVVLVNTKDGSTETKSNIAIAHVTGDTVDNGNAAVATSSCSNCRTVAVAIQAVLGEGSPSVVTPTNLAIALNVNCSGCTTMASAYQYVVTTGGIVHFTQEGQQRMNDINHAIEGLIDSGLPLQDLDAQLDLQVDQLWNVVDTELVKSGHAFEATPHKKVEIEEAGSSCPPGSPSPSPSDTSSPSPTPTDTPSETPSPTATPSPSGSPCPSPSPSQSPSVSASSSESPSPNPNPGPSSSPCPADTPSPTPTPSETPSPSPSQCRAEPPSPSPSASESTGPSPTSTASPPTPTPTGT